MRGSIANSVRKKIDGGGERIWQLSDFKREPVAAVARELSRQFRLGRIKRLSKGIYYRSRQTIFGESRPSMSELGSLPIRGKGIFPAGNGAANLLGFSTQNPARIEVATTGLSLPRAILGKEAMIHTRRPESWKKLSAHDAALLDFLREGGRASELSLDATVDKLLRLFRLPGQFERLFRVSATEPPRVRAILGAIGQQIGCEKGWLFTLRRSLNPLTKFDFGNLIALLYAREWQAKEKRKP